MKCFFHVAFHQSLNCLQNWESNCLGVPASLQIKVCIGKLLISLFLISKHMLWVLEWNRLNVTVLLTTLNTKVMFKLMGKKNN